MNKPGYYVIGVYYHHCYGGDIHLLQVPDGVSLYELDENIIAQSLKIDYEPGCYGEFLSLDVIDLNNMPVYAAQKTTCELCGKELTLDDVGDKFCPTCGLGYE